MSSFAQRTDPANAARLLTTPISLKARDAWNRQVLSDPELPPCANKVATALLLYLNRKEGVAWPSIPTIAADIAMSVPTVKRALRKLKSRGHLIVKSGQGRRVSNVYSLRQKGVSSEPFSDVAHMTKGVGGEPFSDVTRDSNGDATRGGKGVSRESEKGSVVNQKGVTGDPLTPVATPDKKNPTVAFADAESPALADSKEEKRSATYRPQGAEPPLTTEEKEALSEIVLAYYRDTCIAYWPAFCAELDSLFLEMETAVPRFRTPRIDEWDLRGEEVMLQWKSVRDDHFDLAFGAICKVLHDRIQQGATVITSMNYFTDAVELGATL